MSALPRVTEQTRERVSREFDDLGPHACMREILDDLRANNPEILDIARRAARDATGPERTMMGFCMFYRLLTAQSTSAPAESGQADAQLTALPRVAPETRDLVVEEIDGLGQDVFTTRYTDQLGRENPQLLQMAHSFASRYPDSYLLIMQGMALVWAVLVIQSEADRAFMH